MRRPSAAKQGVSFRTVILLLLWVYGCSSGRDPVLYESRLTFMPLATVFYAIWNGAYKVKTCLDQPVRVVRCVGFFDSLVKLGVAAVRALLGARRWMPLGATVSAPPSILSAALRAAAIHFPERSSVWRKGRGRETDRARKRA